MAIDKPYAYHRPSSQGLGDITRLREQFSATERLIRELCGTTRQANLAITNNEQAAMWAIKSVVFNDPESVAE